MNTFWQLYDWNERTFWNSLTKKLSSFLLLYLINLAYLYVYLDQKAFIAAQLAAGQASPELAARINGSLEGGLTVVIVLTLVGLVWNVGQVLYLRYLILNPVRSVITTFNEIAAGAGDFSRDLKPISHDEFRELAESYNRFAEKMRGIISEIRKASIGIATEAVQVKVRVDETGKGARRQGEMTELVFTASTEATQAIDEVSHSTQLISDSTSTNLDGARISLREMQEISSKINGVGEKVLRFNQTVDDLSQRSASINQIAALIREVADQTNLLALNAAIEAARAGEQGRGFAVVADEVRSLASRTQSSAKEVSVLVERLQSQATRAGTAMDASRQSSSVTLTQIEAAQHALGQIVGAVQTIRGMTNQIATAAEEQSQVAEDMNQSLTRIAQVADQAAGVTHDTAASGNTIMQSMKGLKALTGRFRLEA